MESASVTRPVLLGLSNPYSSHPSDALYPHPPGCTGWRLWRMSGMKLEDYLGKFRRANLTERPNLFFPDVVVILGQEVARGMGAEWKLFVPQTIYNDVLAYVVPHPSGLSRAYNDPDKVRRLRNVLRLAVRRYKQRSTQVLSIPYNDIGYAIMEEAIITMIEEVITEGEV